MKKIIIVPVLAVLFTACRDNSITHTAFLKAGEMSDVNSVNSNVELRPSAFVRAGEMSDVRTRVIVKEVPQTQVRERVVYRNTSSHSAQVAKKKGMSARAKYTIVGGVGGAVVGGVATKSTKGAVIGGVIGAGTGYILGRKRDKKTGRIQ